jgi:hypothetical protein
MDINSQIVVPVKPELYRSVADSSSFKPGSTLLLKILELRGDRALIDFGKFKASADIKIPITLGDEIMVRVQESGHQLKLALINAQQSKTLTNKVPHQLRVSTGNLNDYQVQLDLKQILDSFLESRTAKSTPKDILNIFKSLCSHFESFDLEKMAADIMPRLKSYVDNAGFFFEKMLENRILRLKDETDTALPKQIAHHPDIQAVVNRDLKANLLALKSIAGDGASLPQVFDTRSLAKLRRIVDLMLTDIRNQQGMAAKQIDASEPIQVFNYALPLADEKHSAKLKIYYQKQKAGSKDGIQISLLLSMDRLGDLRTDFYLLDKDLTVSFFVKDQITKNRIQKHYRNLQELLNPLFNQVMMQVVASEKKIKDFDVEDNPINGDRRINLRV